MEKVIAKNKNHYFVVYTMLFILMVVAVFGYFFVSGKSFIWNKDGWTQHYKALVYYAKWMREIVRTLIFKHTLTFPEWSFSIGYGSDVLTTFHYYVIGDPLTLFAIFVPTRYLVYFYGILVILRLYLAGLFFSSYCFFMGCKEKSGVLAGAFTYIFCGYALFAAVRHPYFTNPMIYLPLLLIGVEKVMQKKKPYLFIGMVFISAISNFYFFYMLVLLTVLYVIFRLFMLFDLKQIKQMIITVGKLFGFALIGLCMSAVLFLPVVLLFFSDGRSSSVYVWDLFYSSDYYDNIIPSFISYYGLGTWTNLGYASVTLLAIFLLFMRLRKHIALKISFVLLSVFLLIPFVGHVFNGFSYVANRWSWGYSMLVAYILAVMWEELFMLKKKEILGMLILLAFYLYLCRNMTEQRFWNVIVALILAVVGIIVIRFRNKKILLGVVLLAITVNAFYAYSPYEGNYVSEFKNNTEVYNELKNTQDVAVKLAAKEDQTSFYRYSGNTLQQNTSLYSGISTTQYYWSLTNGCISNFLSELALLKNNAFIYKALDSRTSLNALACVKYFITAKDDTDNEGIPYGYTYLGTYEIDRAESLTDLKAELGEDEIADKEVNEVVFNCQNGYAVYRNEYALPLGYTYSSCLTTEQFKQLNAIEKQEALLQGIVLDEIPEGMMQSIPAITNKNINYQLNYDQANIEYTGNSFIVKSPKTTVSLIFQGMNNSETYLDIEGMQFAPKDSLRSSVSIKISTLAENEQVVNKQLRYTTPRDRFYNNRHDFLINLGYGEKAKIVVNITFPVAGIYSFDKLGIVCQSMDNYIEEIQALKKDSLKNIKIGTDMITGEINLKQEKTLCLSIPYSSGWTAYVDGKKTKLLQANLMYMALPLKAGKHSIKLIYHTPGLKVGVGFSVVGMIFLLGIIFLQKKKESVGKK